MARGVRVNGVHMCVCVSHTYVDDDAFRHDNAMMIIIAFSARIVLQS